MKAFYLLVIKYIKYDFNRITINIYGKNYNASAL